MNRSLIPIWVMVLMTFPLSAQTVTLDNGIAKMNISLSGGIIRELSLHSVAVNPMHEYGHFICFDRWGPSSPEDQALGIPFHGEGSNVTWTLQQEPVHREDHYFAEISCFLPIVQLGLDRKIYLDEDSPVFRVEEEISNHGNTEKVFNLVQHATIGAPFLDETTILDTRVDSGFSQAGNLPPAPADLFTWPGAMVDGDSTDLRFLNGDHTWWQAVVTFALDEKTEYGWVTAANPSLHLLVGYMWPVSEYPWLNLWLRLQGSDPFARGLEFGSTGLHQPWPGILAIDTILGRKLYDKVGVGDTVVKTYYAFLSEIPSDFRGVSSVTMSGDKILVEEYGLDPGRRIELDIAGILAAEEDLLAVDKTQVCSARVYPNPFHSAATISFYIPADSHVNLSVFDISGRLVDILVDETLTGGPHSVQFTPSYTASSTFIYKLTTDYQTVTGKMVLL
jgi:hypothetical protein